MPIQLRGTAYPIGLPAGLRAGIEHLSGYSMGDTRVHYDSPKPARLDAHAYTQGTEIHLAPGQERHLPHEAWHVVQQKQGRVRPTGRLNGMSINDADSLEGEAERMGTEALSSSSPSPGTGVIHRSVDPGQATAQRFPRHRTIAAADAPITSDDLLQILHDASQAEIARGAARGATDWFHQFASQGDPAAYPHPHPAATPGLAYHHGSVSHRFTVGGENLVRLGTNNYIYPEGGPAGNVHVSYPELHGALTDHAAAPANEVARAQRIRAMLAAGVTFTAPGAVPAVAGAPTQATHEAVATTALFGAETARAPRTFLSHMMALDRLESQQPYGAGGAKQLTLRKLLHPADVPAPGGAARLSNNQFWVHKQASFGARVGPGAVPPAAQGVGYAPHGGKAAMAGGGTRAMGKAPLPAGGAAPNLTQAKEVNNLVKWLDLQLGAGAFAGQTRAASLTRIQQLVEERAKNYHLMNQGENAAREAARREGAATQIQSRVRGLLARRQADRLRLQKRESAATRIQALTRGMLARKEAGRLRLQRENAATRIQALTRGMLARKEAGRLRLQRENAATRIQALTRGMLARKEAGRLRQEKAATRIQAVARGMLARKEAGRLRLQNDWAESLGRMYGWSGRTIREFGRSDEARRHALEQMRRRNEPPPSYIR